MVRSIRRPLIIRRKYHQLMEMIDNGFSKRLIRELLNYTNKAAGAKFGETKIKVKFELTWSEDMWPLLGVYNFMSPREATSICESVPGRDCL